MRIKDLFIASKNNGFKAKILQKEGMVVLIVLVLISNFFLSKLPQNVTAAEVDINSIVYAHNRERAKYDLNPLSLSAKLTESATLKADAMLESDCWDHYCPIPPGVSPWNWFEEKGYKYISAGENLAEGFSDNDTVMNAWMNSPTHKANVLKKNFEEIGIGFAFGNYQNKSDNTIIIVHFGKPVRETKTNNFASTKGASILEDIFVRTPDSGSIISADSIIVSGSVNILGDKIKLNLNDKFIEEIDISNDSNFSFNLTDSSSIQLQGENKVELTVIKGDSEIGRKSISFFVDNVLPILDVKDISVDDFVKGAQSTIYISLTKYDDYKEAWIQIGDNRYRAELVDGKLVFPVAYEKYTVSPTFEINMIDIAGNKGVYLVDKRLVDEKLKVLEQKINGTTTEETNAEDMKVKEMLSGVFNYELPKLSLRQIINISFLILLMILVWIDCQILKANGLTDLLVVGKHHYKISILFIVSCLLIISTSVGTILTGTSV